MKYFNQIDANRKFEKVFLLLYLLTIAIETEYFQLFIFVENEASIRKDNQVKQIPRYSKNWNANEFDRFFRNDFEQIN
jgi:hypothetical protein